MKKLTITEYARDGFWITADILKMADEDCYQFGNDWCDEDWLTTNGSEDLRFFSYHVVLFRRSQRLSIIQLKRMIECHVDAGTLPAKYHREGERIFNPHEFKSWWFKYDMKTYVEELGFAPSSPLYEVFDEMEKIDGTNKKSPPEEHAEAEKVAKTAKVNKDKNQDSPPRPTSQLLVGTVDKSETGKKPKVLSPDITKKLVGRKVSHLKQPVIQEALLIRKEKGITSAPKIARLSKITKILAPLASHIELKGIKDDEYKKRFGRKPGTVEDWVREGFKENPSS